MQSQLQSVENLPRGIRPRKFVFVLLPKFTLLSFTSALECLRISNR
ncbi:MAG: GlxA family transcriptional regulator, partial [Marinovum sp.]|nr:GlxA family transcriptional regulator [Marinovum sp.]